MLHVEYYSVQWLHRVGNKIGRTLKVNVTVLSASRGEYARICVEIDLRKPLKVGYRLRDQRWKIQYEGLEVICFNCERYGHEESACPTKFNGEERMSASQPPYALDTLAEGVQI